MKETDSIALFMKRLTDAQSDLQIYVAGALVVYPADVDDVVQETNYALIQHAEEYQVERPFLPWALLFAKNQIRTYYKKRSREKLVFDDDLLDLYESSAFGGDGVDELSSQRMKHLPHCLEKLPEPQKQLINLHYFKGRSLHQIAVDEKKPESTVRMTICRARKALADCIQRFCRFENKTEDGGAQQTSSFDGLFTKVIDEQDCVSAEELFSRLRANPAGMRDYADQIMVHRLLSKLKLWLAVHEKTKNRLKKSLLAAVPCNRYRKAALIAAAAAVFLVAGILLFLHRTGPKAPLVAQHMEPVAAPAAAEVPKPAKAEERPLVLSKQVAVVPPPSLPKVMTGEKKATLPVPQRMEGKVSVVSLEKGKQEKEHAMKKSTFTKIAALAVAQTAALVTQNASAAQSKAISFSAYTGTETLTNYPALVVFSPGKDGFSYEGFRSPLGCDLRFSNSTDTVSLDYEIEQWNTNGSSYVWVKVPEFTSNCTIRASWGGTDMEMPVTCTNGAVWDGGYKAVWHMAPGFKDSCGGRLNALATSTAQNADSGIGTSAQEGETNLLELSSTATLPITNQFTISFWASNPHGTKPQYVCQWSYYGESEGQNAIIVGYTTNQYEIFVYNNQTGGAYTGANPRSMSRITLPDSKWHQYAYVYDGSTLRCYRDGTQVSSSAVVFSFKGTGTHVFKLRVRADQSFDGWLDEFRVADVPFSAERIRSDFVLQGRGLEQEMQITFPECAGLQGTLTNFPVLVTLNERMKGFSYAKVASEKGYDVHFWNKDFTEQFDSEIDSWNQNGTSYVWVRVPEFTAATVLNATFGNQAEAVLPICSTNGSVWDNDYRLVYHGDTAKTDTTKYHATATGWAADMIVGAVGAQALHPAMHAKVRIGTGYAEQMYVSFANTNQLSVSNAFTFAWWAKVMDSGHGYLSFAKPVGGDQQAIICGYTAPNSFEFWNSMAIVSGGTDPRPGSQLSIPDRDWHHYAYTYDGQNWRGYRDGIPVFNLLRAFALLPIGAYRLGGTGGSTGYWGGIDEFRLSASPRSAAWIAASAKNQQTYKNGLEYLVVPTFGKTHDAQDRTENGANLFLAFSCKLPCHITVYSGATDGGNIAAAWEKKTDCSEQSGATVKGTLSGLTPGKRYVYRFHAENDYGEVWSEPFTFATKPLLDKYQYKVTFTCSGYKGTETLTNFPTLIVLSEKIRGFHYSKFTSATGADLLFTDNEGVPLEHEIETWNPAGESYVWVRVPRVTAQTKIKAYWRTKEAFPKNDGMEVWDSTFDMVHHLSPALIDSTRNGQNVSNSNAVDAVDKSIDSVIGQGRNFPGTQSCLLSVTNDTADKDAFMYSIWSKLTPSAGKGYLYFNRSSVEQNSCLICGFTSNCVDYFPADYAGEYTNAQHTLTIDDDAWHQYVISYDSVNWRQFKDGVCVYDKPLQFLRRSSGIAAHSLGISGMLNSFVGSLDEFRAENVGRSTDWIQAAYKTQSAPAAFAVPGEAAATHGFVIMLK